MKKLILPAILVVLLGLLFIYRDELHRFYTGSVSDNELREMVERNNAAVEEYAVKLADMICEKNRTDYGRIRAAHDYLVEHVTYDTEAAENISGLDDSTVNSMTAYGALIEGKAICSGYAAAFSLLMDKMGIENGTIDGYTTGGVMHRWNFVRLDGSYYHVDVTFDDTDDGVMRDRFFLVPDEMILKDRVIVSKVVPACENYYKP